jgi:ABC-type uncharacterized transport system substrate-binding protein
MQRVPFLPWSVCLFAGLLVGSFLFPLSSAAGQIDEPIRVFVVHSYGPNHICGAPQFRGIERAFREHPLFVRRVVFEHFYMRTKYQYTGETAIRQRGELARAEITRMRPDLILTIDDNAFRTVALSLAGTDSETPIVFSGLNNPPEWYNEQHRFMHSRSKPGGNITGIYEKLFLRKALEVMKEVLPTCGKIVGITDFSPTGQAIARQMELETSGKQLPVVWESRQARTFADYQAIIMALNQDPDVCAIYPAAMSMPDGSGKSVSTEAIFAWTIAHSMLPELPANYDFCRLGLFGGAAINFESMGYAAGLYALEILGGQSAGDLPIVDAPEFAIVFNTARAAMLSQSIPLSLLTASDRLYTSIPLLTQP